MKNHLKRLFTSVVMSLLAICMYGQDTMITQDGDVKTVYVVDIGSTAVFYKTENTDNAAIQSISKDQIFVIKRPDGTKYDLGSAPTPAVYADVPMQTHIPQLSDEMSEEAMEANRRRIEEINSVVPEYINKKKGDAERIFCAMGVGSESCLVNDELEVALEVGYIYNDLFHTTLGSSTANQALRITLKNKLTQTIYVDLGTSFFRRGDKATPYFIPSATSTSTSNTTGGSVNAGAVAGALGIGGSIGRLAGGINVGGSSTSSSVSVTYSQRVVAVPPMSTISLEPQLLFQEYRCDGMCTRQFSKKERVLYFQTEKKGVEEYALGETHDFSEQNSPLRFSTFITYSLTEDCAQTKSITSSLYLRKIIGVRKPFGLNVSFGTDLDKNVSDYDKCIYFQGVVDGWPVGKNGKIFPRP